MTSQATPIHCRPEAYEAFTRVLPMLETSDGLLRAAVAVSMHELPDASATVIDNLLDEMAGRVRQRVRSGQPRALLAHLHQTLFDEEGFTGNTEDYHNPLNSYLPVVMQSRLGLPITLSLIYKLVADRVGLTAMGLHTPYHFLTYVTVEGQGLIIDAFAGGRLLTLDELYRFLDNVSGSRVPRGGNLLAPATHRQWLARMIQNLIVVFERKDQADDAAAMSELLRVMM
ncbi:MAG: transglutaminase family protein [Phycisphaeraceae bacterium]|nr:transglutaminase family protein [Phycisphaeraceae bacterium]